jgi:SSS family solute:Na+ symporter
MHTRHAGLSFLLAALCAAGPRPANAQTESLRPKALHVLRTAMESEQRWIKVHAAEALLALDEPRDVARTFESELAAKGAEPQYRIGIWRVLAQAARGDQQREPWITKILSAFKDARGPDRLHAAETLGKLGYRAGELDADAFDLAARTGPGPLAANARWVLANSGRPDGDIRLAELLGSDDAGTRATAAYAIRYLPTLSTAAWEKLAAAARNEPGGEVDIVRASLVSAAFVHAPAAQKARFKADVVNYARTGTSDAKVEACAALAQQGRSDDLPLLSGFLDDKNPDVRVGAALAIGRILTAR